MNRQPRQPWYDSDNPATVVRGATWRAAIWIFSVVAFVGILAAGIWAVKVATSDIRGRGDATRQVNSADNRLFAQGNFHDLYNDVISYDQRLDQAAADKAAHAGKDDASYWDTNYTGLVNQCISARNQYNADARKITQAKFRDEDLPYQIDTSDPKTDCKETVK